jgi:glycosyltransferase involved in cell wall biosynthesis
MGLDRYRDLQIPDPKTPRRVTYKRRGPRVFFWPDYSRYNPYQRLLYASARDKAEFIGADIDTALHVLSADPGDPGKTSFHLHWLNKVTSQAHSKEEAKAQAGSFLTTLQSFKGLGGRLIWTVHNVLSHDTPWPEAETALAQGIIALADHVHLHSAASLQETSSAFTIPKEKLTILPHGNYAGWYPEYISRGQARAALGLSATDDVILVPGQIRPYKGVGDLIAATRSVLHERPNARLLIAGQMSDDVHAALLSAAGRDAQNQLRLINRFVDDAELQLFFGAADFAVLPYRRVLTSGSLILALGFGVPVVVPEVGMTRQVIAGSKAGLLCNAADGMALETAVRGMLRHKDQGHLPEMRVAARERAAALSWGDFSNML